MKSLLLAAFLSVLSPAMGTAQPSTSFVIDYQNPRVVGGALVSDRVTVGFTPSTVKVTRLAVGKTSSVVMSGFMEDEISVQDGTKKTVYTATSDGQTFILSSDGKNPLTVACLHARVLTER